MAQIDDVLRPLAGLFKKKDLKEISINEPGQVWLETAGKGYSCERMPVLTEEWCLMLVKTLGYQTRSGYSDEKPIVSCTLPQGHRFQGLVSPTNVLSGVAISIRMQRDFRPGWEDFGVTDRTIPLRDSDYGDGPRWVSEHAPGSVNWLEDLIRQGAPVLVSGGTSTGKTTFLNTRILPMVPKHFRVITIQDTPEIRLEHENRVELIVPRTKQPNASQLTYQNIIDNVNRLNPTQLILGELSVDNAFGALRLLNMGESSFIATLHANSPLEALEAFRRNIDLSGHSSIGAVGLLARTIGAIVHLEFDQVAGRPRLKEIVSPHSLPWQKVADDTGISSDIKEGRVALQKIGDLISAHAGHTSQDQGCPA